MLCADGSLLLVSLDERGAEASRFRSAVFFDPEKDPLVEKPVRSGSVWYFVSFDGYVHEVDLAGDTPRFAERVVPVHGAGARPSPGASAARSRSRCTSRPGVSTRSCTRAGRDGHKESGSAVAVFDTAKRERVQTVAIGNLVAAFLASRMELDPASWGAWILDAIVPNAGADRIAVTQDEAPRLILVSEEGGTLGIHDALSGALLRNINDVGLVPRRDLGAVALSRRSRARARPARRAGAALRGLGRAEAARRRRVSRSARRAIGCCPDAGARGRGVRS